MSYRLTINPAVEVGDNTISFTFSTKQEMESNSNRLADMLLYLQDELQVMHDYSNIFLKEELIDGEWIEIENEE
jgi:hypothetical protein